MWTLLPLLIVATAGQEPATVTQDSSPQRPAQGLTLALYEVRDLALGTGPDFEAPQLGITSPAQQPRPPSRRLDPGALPAGFEQVVEVEPSPEELARGSRILEQLVRTYIAPPLSGPGEEVRSTPGATLVVNARPEQQEWVERFLGDLRGFDGMIELQARLYTTPRGLMREWGIAPSATLPTSEELAELSGRLQADERVEVVTAPRVLQFPCQRTNMAIVSQVAYVKGAQLHIVEPGGREIADPEIAVVQEGVVVDARATPLPGERFGLQLELSRCELERPIPTRKIRISASSDQEVEIGEPEVKTTSFAATVMLPEGASAVLVTADSDQEKDLAVVVTLRRVARPEHVEER
jgi:hypothetical protein